MLTCQDIADYFITRVDEETDELISNLKLQKLVYYAQGFHLAMYDRPLFREPIRAWFHGPVVPELYHKYKQYGANGIPRPEDGIDLSKYEKHVCELLDEVHEVYGQFSAWKLRDLTHAEPPWKDTPLDNEISHESMRTYFKTQLVDGPEAA